MREPDPPAFTAPRPADLAAQCRDLIGRQGARAALLHMEAAVRDAYGAHFVPMFRSQPVYDDLKAWQDALTTELAPVAAELLDPDAWSETDAGRVLRLADVRAQVMRLHAPSLGDAGGPGAGDGAPAVVRWRRRVDGRPPERAAPVVPNAPPGASAPGGGRPPLSALSPAAWGSWMARYGGDTGPMRAMHALAHVPRAALDWPGLLGHLADMPWLRYDALTAGFTCADDRVLSTADLGFRVEPGGGTGLDEDQDGLTQGMLHEALCERPDHDEADLAGLAQCGGPAAVLLLGRQAPWGRCATQLLDDTRAPWRAALSQVPDARLALAREIARDPTSDAARAAAELHAVVMDADPVASAGPVGELLLDELVAIPRVVAALTAPQRARLLARLTRARRLVLLGALAGPAVADVRPVPGGRAAPGRSHRR